MYLTPAGVELNCSEGVLPAGGQCTLIVTVKPWQRARSQVAIRYRVVLQDSKEGGRWEREGEGGGRGRGRWVTCVCRYLYTYVACRVGSLLFTTRCSYLLYHFHTC